MPTFSFWAGESSNINNLSGSGLGFFGDAGAGASVAATTYQGRTFICDSNGLNSTVEADNIKFLNAGSGIIGQAGSGIALTCIPNERSTLQITFSHDTPVQVDSVRLYGYDRVNYINAPSGVTFKAAELIHPSASQDNSGSGDTTWTNMTGSGSFLTLANSPGPSGLYAANGTSSTWADTNHSWYVALSASPDTVGSKTFALWVSCEYH